MIWRRVILWNLSTFRGNMSPFMLSVFLCLFFGIENGGDMFLWEFCWLSTNYTALNPRTKNSSYLPLREISIHLFFYLSIYLSIYLVRFFSFLILHTVGRTQLTADQPVERPLLTYRKTQTHNKRTQTSMPWVRFQPTIPAFERAKKVHALDRAATVIGLWDSQISTNNVYITWYQQETNFQQIRLLFTTTCSDTCAIFWTSL
jgi:hypothetical protein